MRVPSTLRLPFWAATRFRIEEILRAHVDGPWSFAWRLREMFSMGEPEIALARALLQRRRNLWLYRTNQRHFCGDFVAVDMSAPRDRRAWAIELKAGEPVRFDVGGIQFAGLAVAVDELRPLIGAGPVVTARGGSEAVLRWLRT